MRTAFAAAEVRPRGAAAAEFAANLHEEPKEWQAAPYLGNADLWLTAEETREVDAGLAAVLAPYRGRTLADRPDGARRVRVTNLVFPHRRR